MFTFIFRISYYNAIKSGFLFDYLFKKIAFFFLIKLFVFYNIFFSEKYFVEYFFFKIKKCSIYLSKITTFFFNEFTYIFFGFILFMFLTMFFILF